MPLLKIKISGDRNAESLKNISNDILKSTTDILGKDPTLTTLLFEFIPKEQWFIGDISLADSKKNSFSLEIHVTDETNTKKEKSAYIKSIFSIFSKHLDNIADESYIYINDVRAAAFGYAGLTQEHRYHK